MSGPAILTLSAELSLGLLLLAMVLTIYRMVRGPTLADRVLALDMLTLLAVGFIAALTVLTGFELYVDIAIAIGLVSFLSTIALARYLLNRPARKEKT